MHFPLWCGLALQMQNKGSRYGEAIVNVFDKQFCSCLIFLQILTTAFELLGHYYEMCSRMEMLFNII